eukprot:1730092-Pleurochrysis_carterae.AAC.1
MISDPGCETNGGVPGVIGAAANPKGLLAPSTVPLGDEASILLKVVNALISKTEHAIAHERKQALQAHHIERNGRA